MLKFSGFYGRCYELLVSLQVLLVGAWRRVPDLLMAKPQALTPKLPSPNLDSQDGWLGKLEGKCIRAFVYIYIYTIVHTSVCACVYASIYPALSILLGARLNSPGPFPSVSRPSPRLWGSGW